ncbi:type II secretion system protein [Candidatus Nomurabacteria bacterium]|nr:type II secretion system protein [Candidatus Nomurabacteria bacterium]
MIQRGFTLIELMIVIALIALMGSFIFVAIDPAKRIGEAKDAIRMSESLAMEKAIEKIIAEEAGLPIAMSSLIEDVPYMLVVDGGDDSGGCNCNTLDESIERVDLSSELQSYLGIAMPVDPDATGDDTGYYITRSGHNFSVSPCYAHGDEFEAPPAPCNGFSKAFCPDVTGPQGVEDGLVNFEDMIYLSMGTNSCADDPESWFEPFYKADFNNDCCIDSADFACFNLYYGTAVDCATFTGTCPS